MILNLNEQNCPAFNKAITDNYNTFTTNVQTTYKDFLTRLNTLSGLTLDVPGALNFCAYLKWADLHNVALSFDYTDDDITQCDGIKTLLFNFYVTQDQNLNFIASHQFLQQTHDQIKSILGLMEYEHTAFYKLASKQIEQELHADA